MIRINLLPHREMRRERRKKDFIGLASLIAILSGVVVFVVGLWIDNQIDAQVARNDFIKKENVKLEEQIKEIASLQAEIDALKARQQSVENLQSDRTTPVHVLDELVKQVPEGIFLKSLRQDERKLALVGNAQSNERISELLRNLGNSTVWIEKPELVEIKVAPAGPPVAGKPSPRNLFEFSIVAQVKTPLSPNDPAKKAPAMQPIAAAAPR